MSFDFIIAGSGCAGLSLLYRLLKEPKLKTKKIAVIDKVIKKDNDRTWCYWEKEKGLFDAINFHEWNTLKFISDHFETQFEMKEYTYKMIRGIDFYEHIISYASQFENVTFITDEIKSITDLDQSVEVSCLKDNYKCNYVFNSTPIFYPKMETSNTLLQHFMGWKIKAKASSFNPEVGTLMDFSVHQNHGTTFMYVLPTDTHSALVEYTLFTESTLNEEDYKKELREYIKETLGIQDYSIEEEEYGIIPMTQAKFEKHHGNNIIHIGTAGGYTKASSGYTFQFIQNHLIQLVDHLKSGKSPVINPTIRQKKFDWYDQTLLEVLISGRMKGKDVFTKMFKKVAPEKIMGFLANESTFMDEFKIMLSMPTSKFLPAGIKKLFG